jgi:rare lipoprotein A
MRRPLARAVAVLVALALAGCASDGHVRMSPFPAPKTPVAKHGKLDPRLPVMPAAGSGRGGYYLDDGPGDNPPPGLYDVPDPIVKSEVLSRYGNKPYVIFGKTYTPLGGDSSFVQRGVASWYGKKFHGQRTSSGELYDMYLMSAAHPTLPIPSFARVTSIETGKSVVVRVNDRGPFHASRVIDVSYTAALKLGLLGKGSHEVEIERLLPEDSSRRATARRNAPAPVALATMPTIAQADATLVSSAVSAQSTEVLAVMGEPAASAGSSVAPVAGDGFYLQLGAFSQIANATEARARVLATGIVNLVEIVQAGSLHRLFGGPFASREDALKAAAALPAGLAVKALVVKRSGAAAVQ